ncbi:MAG: LL-diaminopimelate aminotransferase [Verrucomicrobia bacterium]|nr:LL-diaminopimelate aminotransferase [Verrucomicrobiota bacterium]
MANLNPHFKRLKREYIFPVIEQKLAELKQEFPTAQILNFGIGDIALPLAPSIAKAIADGVQEMTTEKGMRGYGPSNGYAFLREAICAHEFSHLGIAPDEIFVSDGANSDTVNILELFSISNVIGITDPTYPAYLDASILQGQKKIITFPCLPENHFAPLPPQEHCDVIFLCSPNNPTGMAMTQSDLKAWVDYAINEKALLLIDNAYEAFITSKDVPHSIFEIPGAKECAIEFRSFSKSAGFTGLRCAYTILPKTVKARLGRKMLSLHPFWDRRQATKFNGVAYPVQRGAEAVYSDEGKQQTRAQVQLYLSQAARLKEGLSKLGFTCYGGVDSPYVWVKTPEGHSSWEFFDMLLKRCHLICIPGRGFGSHGEGFVRFSSFTTPDKTTLALERLHQM